VGEDVKYSIVMPYYKRVYQLSATLVSLEHHYSKRDDYEVVIVTDPKNDDRFDEVARDWASALPLAVVRGRVDRPVYNPSPFFNQGAYEATGEYIVLTSPECFHLSDVLGGLDEEFDRDPVAYVVCACDSGLRCSIDDRDFGSFRYEHHMWYHKSNDRNTRYHFCSAMSRSLFVAMGGFDQDYADGIAYDDDDFRDRVEHAGIRFVLRDDLVVVHQEHDRTHETMNSAQYLSRLNRNKELYAKKKRLRESACAPGPGSDVSLTLQRERENR
jgi:glycosyltransferase involved in cell wall biosynthesis